jgi:streptomycin 6-kinase
MSASAGGLSLDIPDQVRKTVIADGNESWLDELPGVVDSLAREWSLMIGSSFAGGHAALVVEVRLLDGTPAVLKIGVPGRDVGQEATVLRLANGGGCAKLLGEDAGAGDHPHPRSITGPMMNVRAAGSRG